MERPRFEVKTTGGHIIVLNEYITGAENWEIRKYYITGDATADKGDLALQAEKLAYKLIIVSVDGVANDVANALLALPLPDYKEVVDHVTAISEGKKNSSASRQIYNRRRTRR
jgi:diacylglycerol kinase family enzyme